MFCQNCGKECSNEAKACPTCGQPFMSRNNTQANAGDEKRKKNILMLKIFYVFLVLFPLVSIIGDYILRSDFKQDDVLLSHCKYQIRTFWLSFIIFIVLMIAGPLLALATMGIGSILVGILGLVVFAWVLYRVIKGFLALEKGNPIAV
ncbi:MAG: hypothetical protein LBR31_07885 [Desulfovibrio sp.]|jgi:uncharacterized membrane protein|nr:hypothetical protein [Desulfovibrio sp.]